MNGALPFTALIPARMASTRLPGKPLADIAGVPMVVHVARRAAKAGAERVVVAADDARILDACAAHGITAIATRPDHANGSDRLAEACAILGLADDAIVVNVQGDEPLIAPALIAACAARLHADAAADMATAAHAIHDAADYANPHVVKVVLGSAQQALYFSRALVPLWRDAPTPGALPPGGALRHIGIYAYRAGALKRYAALPPAPIEAIESLEQLRVLWHGGRIAVHIAAEAPAAGVDTPADLERVRAMLAAAPGGLG